VKLALPGKSIWCIEMPEYWNHGFSGWESFRILIPIFHRSLIPLFHLEQLAPKPVLIPHEFWIYAYDCKNKHMGTTSEDIIYNCFPMFNPTGQVTDKILS
jgi:hypothetical protein